MKRERLPDRRESESVSFHHEGIDYIAQISRYADGRIGEVFLDPTKPGGPLDAMAKDMAVVTSLALQYGVPVSDILPALSQELSGEMRGPLGVMLKLFQAAERSNVVRIDDKGPR